MKSLAVTTVVMLGFMFGVFLDLTGLVGHPFWLVGGVVIILVGLIMKAKNTM